MDEYRMNVRKMLQIIQVLYQNNKLQPDQKNSIISLAQDGMYNYESRVQLGWYIKDLLNKEQDMLFVKEYQNFLQLITI